MFLSNVDTNTNHIEKRAFEVQISDKTNYGFENFYGPNFRVFWTVNF